MANISVLAGLKSRAKTEGWSKYITNDSDELALLNGCYFDIERAERVGAFFPKFIKHSKGRWAGKPFELLDWQREEVVYPLFGWYRPDGVHRRFKSTYLEVPKKNGKSTLAAAIGNYKFAGDGEMGAHVYSAAADREQAGIVHNEAINMVEGSPQLSQLIKVNKSTYTMSFPKMKSFYKSISHVAGTNEGHDISCVIIDELHSWKKDDLWFTLRYGTVARVNPLIFVITTAGDNQHSICWRQHEYAEQVMCGDAKDDSILCMIKAAGPDDDWEDPETWRKANPSMGVTLTESDFAQNVEEAKMSETVAVNLKRYRLNIWATSSNPWLRREHWTNCRKEYTEEDLHKKVCYGGLDLAKTQDTTSFALVFPENSGGQLEYRSLVWFWLPEDVAKEQGSRVPWLDWAKKGFVTFTDGNVADYRQIKDDLVEIFRKFDVKTYCFDPWMAQPTTQDLSEITKVERKEFAQNMSNFSEPTKELERLVILGDFHHNGNEVLSWQAMNTQVKSDMNTNYRPVKPVREDHRKIDGVIAMTMALSIAMQIHKKKGSIYDNPGNLSM